MSLLDTHHAESLSYPDLSVEECQVAVIGDSDPELRIVRQLLEALLFERLLSYQYRTPYFDFAINGVSCRLPGRITGFGRVRLQEQALQILIKRKPETFKLPALIKGLLLKSDIERQLLLELQQTLDFCRWNQANVRRVCHRRNLSYSQLESAISEGHPYHPCFKARTGRL